MEPIKNWKLYYHVLGSQKRVGNPKISYSAMVVLRDQNVLDIVGVLGQQEWKEFLGVPERQLQKGAGALAERWSLLQSRYHLKFYWVDEKQMEASKHTMRLKHPLSQQLSAVVPVKANVPHPLLSVLSNVWSTWILKKFGLFLYLKGAPFPCSLMRFEYQHCVESYQLYVNKGDIFNRYHFLKQLSSKMGIYPMYGIFMDYQDWLALWSQPSYAKSFFVFLLKKPESFVGPRWFFLWVSIMCMFFRRFRSY